MNRRLMTVVGVHPSARRSPRRSKLRRPILAVATAVSGVVGIGGPLGIVLGVGAGVGIVVTARESPEPTAVLEDVPPVIELIAGCLAAGLAMPVALEAASVAGDPVTRAACLASAAALRHGAPSREAWQSWWEDPSLEPVARATTRTTQSGAAVADDLRRVAARLRERRHSRLQQRVQQASIWVVVPLGLFFLPAFVLVAVVPVVIGLFQHVR